MTTSQRANVVEEEVDLIERFLAAYNAIDQHLRGELDSDKAEPFSRLIDEYADRTRGWAYRQDLRLFADLRNVIVHSRTKPYQHVAVPVPDVVARIEAIRDSLLEPALVIPEFQCDVLTVQTDDSLLAVLQHINQNDFSQFPVYADDQFAGLITENGITRWLAHHAITELSLVELADVTVGEVLRDEEDRSNVEFVGRNMTVDSVTASFGHNPVLEAVLITHSGRRDQELLGIVTRWDILQHADA